MVIDPLMEIKIVKYGTSKTYCNCPDYLYRRARTGDSCKHMVYIQQRDQECLIRRESDAAFNPDDFRGKGMEVTEAGDKYGDNVLKDWQKKGQIFMDKNKRWRLLE